MPFRREQFPNVIQSRKDHVHIDMSDNDPNHGCSPHPIQTCEDGSGVLQPTSSICSRRGGSRLLLPHPGTPLHISKMEIRFASGSGEMMQTRPEGEG